MKDMKCSFCKELVSFSRMAYHLRTKHKDKSDQIYDRDTFALYHTLNAKKFFRRKNV